MRGQIGLEIMGIVGLALLLLIPMSMWFYSYSNTYWERLGIEKADMAATRLANMVDMVGTQGDAMLMQEVTIPENVEQIRISGREVAFRLSTSSGETDIVKLTSHEVAGELSSLKGDYYVKAEAQNGIVKLGLSG